MSDTFLAIFLGDKDGARRREWDALSDDDRRAREMAGMAGWKAWVEKNQASLVQMGGPLGKTKRVSADGIQDISNQLGAFTIVRADSQEAAAKLFEGHPHFTIFPGESIEVMECLPIPGM